MKIVVTGSLGHISQPLTKQLVQEGHAVTVISSKAGKKKEIEALGARAAIGTVKDTAFLTAAFTGADVVYCMLPPFDFMGNPHIDVREEARIIATCYADAIRQSAVKRVIQLSSVGAHMASGNGILAFHYVAEKVLKQLPPDVSITHMRPVGFYYNLYSFTDMIKGKGFLEGFLGKFLTLRYYGLMALLQGKSGIILSNYGGDDMNAWVSPVDIAAAIADEINRPPAGRKVRYVASEEQTGYETATILGTAVGKPYMKWELISDRQMLNAMKQAGASDSVANDVVEMNAGMHSGVIFEDYYRHKPAEMGKVKMKDFAAEFAAAYQKNK